MRRSVPASTGLASASYFLCPMNDSTPLGKFFIIAPTVGPSLLVLQHHLKSLAGGPKCTRFPKKASVGADSSMSWRSCLFAVSLTCWTVSVNSSPVLTNSTRSLYPASSVRSTVAREPFPPENDTMAGVVAFSTFFLMKSTASSRLFSMIALLFSTSWSHV